MWICGIGLGFLAAYVTYCHSPSVLHAIPGFATKVFTQTYNIFLGLGLCLTSGLLALFIFSEGQSFWHIFGYSFLTFLTGILAIRIIITFVLVFLAFRLSEATPGHKPWIEDLGPFLVDYFHAYWHRTQLYLD